MSARGACAALASLVALGCGGRPRSDAERPARLDGVSHCDYHVRAVSEKPLVLEVEASCRGRGVRGLEAEDARVADAVGTVTSVSADIARRGAAFLLPHPVAAAHFRYQLDLDQLARPKSNFDLALRSGRSLLAPASSYLLYPLPLDVGTEIEVTLETPPAMSFATGLAKKADHYRLEAHEIPVATYSAFGVVEQRRIALAGSAAELELAVLDGALQVDVDTLAAWVKQRGEAVAEFYRGFPAARTLVVVVPVPGRSEVVFGKLLPESAPGVVLLVGSQAGKAALHDDWVLVHELFHIGVPSFYREGKWFDEGLATYFEPIIRVRAGLYDAASAWRDFALEMPRALSALTRDGLEHTRNYTGLYWGGAIYCLAADVGVRSQSRGQLGLEDGMRRVFREGGHAWDVWPLERALRTADSVFPEPLLLALSARYANAPAPFDLEALFRSLGVERRASGIELSDAAPLAWVRHAIFEQGGARERGRVTGTSRRAP